MDVKWIALSLLVFQNGITPILFRYATTEVSADEKFSTPVAVTVQEFMKLIASMLLFLKEVNWQPDVWWQGLRSEVMENPLQTSKLAVPAALYFLQNQSLQIASAHLPAAVFQVLYNGKTLVVAVFSVFLLRKALNRAKWLALGMMSAGLAVVQLGAGQEKSQASMGNDADQSVPLGLLVVLLGCLCSGFAGVYFEMMMKPQPNADGSLPKTPSMWVRNMELAFFSLVIGAFQITASGVGSGSTGSIFNGFTPKVWYMMVNNALGGLLVAIVIKYADNILKGFACALATIVATFASVPLFGYQIGALFVCGVLIVLYSVLLYGGSVKVPGSKHGSTEGDEYWEQDFAVCTQLRNRSSGDVSEKEMLVSKTANQQSSSPVDHGHSQVGQRQGSGSALSDIQIADEAAK